MVEEHDKGWLAGVFDRAAATYDAAGGGYHDEFGVRLVAAAGVRSGDRVLDVACGRGAVLEPAARVAGRGGRVFGVDVSSEMVRLAGERVIAAGLDADTAKLADLALRQRRGHKCRERSEGQSKSCSGMHAALLQCGLHHLLQTGGKSPASPAAPPARPRALEATSAKVY